MREGEAEVGEEILFHAAAVIPN